MRIELFLAPLTCTPIIGTRQEQAVQAITLPLGALFRIIARFIGLLLPRQFCQFRLGRTIASKPVELWEAGPRVVLDRTASQVLGQLWLNSHFMIR